ncbi:glycosyltransferase family 39 protein [Aquifex pyrophilus]
MEKRVFVLLVLFSFLSLFPYINDFPFRGEEATRTVVAYEMAHFGNYFQPTILGDNYYNKPPLFNWFIVLSSKLLGWDIITPRAVTIVFTLLNALLVYLFARKILDEKTAFLSAGIFITFSDVLFWYGWLAEIDMALSFFVTLLFIQVYEFYRTEKPIYLYTSSLLTGIAFMIKGFPALAFFGLSLIAVALFKRKISLLFKPHALFSYVLAILFSLWWLPFSENPTFYIRRLWEESFSRVESSKNIGKFIEHLITYPLLNLKQTLPASVFVLGIILSRNVKLRNDIKFLLFLLFINYIPYLISATSRGRYVLPLFPVLAVIFGYLIKEFLSDKWKKVLVFTMFFFVFIRFIYGFLYLPYLDERRGKPKERAKEVYELVKDSRVACDCPHIKDFCLYVGFLKGEALIKSKYVKDWEYLIDCRKRNFPLVESLKVNHKDVYLYKRHGSVYAYTGEFSLCPALVFEGLHR